MQRVARPGLLVRHLVLPENLAGTDRILKFLAEEVSPETRLNLMDQYRPCHCADRFPPLDRRLTGETKLRRARAVPENSWKLIMLNARTT